MWQLGALHKIESEDVVNAVVRYESGATGVIQASTAFWPGYTERTEFHGTKGTAIISGDKLTTWDVRMIPAIRRRWRRKWPRDLPIRWRSRSNLSNASSWISAMRFATGAEAADGGEEASGARDRGCGVPVVPEYGEGHAVSAAMSDLALCGAS